MLTLEITIQRRTAESWPLVAEQLQPGLLPTRSEGVLTLNQTALLAQLTPRAYGTALGQAIFQGQIRDAFAGALAESAEGIRLLLFVEADDLRQLRWERLCAPFQQGRATHWDFLTLNHRTLFSLYLPSLTDRRYPPIGRRDLRALVLIASPNGLTAYGLQPFDATAAATQVQAALGAIPFDLLASGSTGAVPNAVGPASLTALCQRLTDTYYTLVHVVCHGAYDHKSGETSLFLADNEHQLDRIEGTRLLDQLGRLRGRRGLPHLAFLATCESAAPAAEGALGGLAQRLVRDLGMPAVIAMTEKVSLLTVQLLTSGFYAQLQATGEVDRALVEAAIAVAERSDATVPAIYSRLGSQPLFSRAVARELTATELAYGLDLLGPLLAARAPTLAPTFTQAATILRRTLQLDVASLDHAAQQERQAALDEVATISAKATDLSFKALSQGDPPPAYDARCPFRGLVAFGVADQAFFFGREALVAQIVMRLAQSPFLALLGPSGSGKSSLVLAGVIPALQKLTPTLAVQIITPGADPVTALATAHTVLAAQPTAHAALLVIDQFEESFTLCSDGARRQAFFQQIFALVAPSDRATLGQPSAPLTVMLTMRADFWGDCASYPQLRDWLLAQQLLIGPMTASELRSAMEQQAGVVGLRFEADLANTILDDVAGEPGAMPLLQHGLRELWQRRYGRWLVAAEYREMGGIKESIARTADKIYQSLTGQEQKVFQYLIIRLVRLDTENSDKDQRKDTRKKVTIASIVTTKFDRETVHKLITKLADARLVTIETHTTTGEIEIELAHDALIQHWGMVKSWIQENLADYIIHQDLTLAASRWVRSDKESDYLYRGARLSDVRIWSQKHADHLTADESAFLAQSLSGWRFTIIQRLLLVVVGIVILIGLAWSMVTERGIFAPRIEYHTISSFNGLDLTDLIWADAQTAFVGMGENEEQARIARTIDGGDSWEFLALQGGYVASIVIHPADPATVYAVLDPDGLFRSTDRGDHWELLSSQLPIIGIDSLAVDPNGILYIGDWMQPIGVWTSNNEGRTWNKMTNTPDVNVFVLEWMNDTLIAGTADGVLFWDAQSGWRWELKKPLAILSFLPLHDSLIAGGQGIFHIRRDYSVEQLFDQPVSAVGVDKVTETMFLAATEDKRIIQWNAGQKNIRELNLRVNDLPRVPIRTIQSSPLVRGEFWLTTQQGLLKVSIRRWYHVGGQQ